MTAVASNGDVGDALPRARAPGPAQPDAGPGNGPGRRMSQENFADAVFGRGSRRNAMWFHPERFLAPEFQAEAYVADLRRFVCPGPHGLDQSCAGLQRQQTCIAMQMHDTAIVMQASTSCGAESSLYRC